MQEIKQCFYIHGNNLTAQKRSNSTNNCLAVKTSSDLERLHCLGSVKSGHCMKLKRHWMSHVHVLFVTAVYYHYYSDIFPAGLRSILVSLQSRTCLKLCKHEHVFETDQNRSNQMDFHFVGTIERHKCSVERKI